MLAETPEAQDLIALLDVLVSTGHDLSLARALRSPLFGATDLDLLAIRAQARRRRRAGGARCASSRRRAPPSSARDRCSGAGRRSSPRCRRTTCSIASSSRATPTRATPPRCRPSSARSRSTRSTPCSRSRSLSTAVATRRRTPSCARSRSGRVKAALPVRASTVRLLTVHGAKGLEADTVFVMDTEPERTNPATTTLLVEWPVEAERPTRCAFVYNENRCPPSLRAALDDELRAREREELNGLYVAMSRAKRRLVFSATEPYLAPIGPTWWSRVGAACPAVAAAAGRAALRPARRRRRSGGAARGHRHRDAAAVARVRRSAAGAAAHRGAGGERAHRPGRPPRARMDRRRRGDRSRRSRRRRGARVRRRGRVGAPRRGRHRRPSRRRPLLPRPADPLARQRGVAQRRGRGAAHRPPRPASTRATARSGGCSTTSCSHAPDELDAYRAQLLRYRAAVARAQPGEAVRCAFITGDGQGRGARVTVQRFTARNLTFPALIAPSAGAPVGSNQANSVSSRCRPLSPRSSAPRRRRAPSATSPCGRLLAQERADDGLARDRHAHRHRDDAVDAAAAADRRLEHRQLAAHGAARGAARSSRTSPRSPSAACTSTGRTSPSTAAPA